MAKKNVSGETPPPKETKAPKDDLMSDIVLVMDKQELKLSVVSEVDEKGKAETVPAEEKNENSFLKFSGRGNVLENFLKNFVSQWNDPTRFNLLKMNLSEYRENKQAIKDLAEGKQTDLVKEFLKKYEIKPRESQKESQKQESNNQKNENEMPKEKQSQPTPQPTPQTNENPSQSPADPSKYRYNESLINFEQLKNFGLSKEYLQKSGLLETMLKGYKTSSTVPIQMNFGSAVLQTDARLSFQQKNGNVVLAIHGIRKEPDLDRPYFGHIFTEDDKKALKETGNMGRVANLKNGAGEIVPSLISLDKLTNEVVGMRVENVSIPNEIKGVKLEDHEKEDLKAGKAVYLEGMISNKGTEFNANVKINADRRGIEFIFEKDKIFNAQTIGGVQLTPKQVEALNGGKAILVEDMKRTDGQVFSSFVKLDNATGRPQYTRYNPDSPEGAREIYVPKEINGARLTPEDRQLIGQGKPVFLENMTNSKGEQFSSFVKLDMETGRPMYAKSTDGFSQRAEIKVPAEVMGVLLSAKQRAVLQDGKSTFIEGIKGYDGKVIDQYAKVNPRTGSVNLYNEDPDRVRNASQRDVVKEKNGQQKENNQTQSQSPAKQRKRSGVSVG